MRNPGVMDAVRFRALHIISGLDPKLGGVGHVVRTLAPALSAYGINSEVVSLDSPDASFLGKDQGLTIHALGPPKTSWAWSPILTPWLKQSLVRYNAIICHGLWQYPLLTVRRQIIRRRKLGKAPRFYVYPHGMLDPWFQRDASRRLKALRNEIYWRLIERKTVNSTDALLFTCEEERRLAQTTFPGYRAKEKVVGYGVTDPPSESESMEVAFRGACPSLRPKQPYLLFLSRIHPKKGLELLIRGYARVIEKGSESEMIGSRPDLVIAGPTDSEYAEQMKRLASELISRAIESGGVRETAGPKIHFPGMLQGEAKWGAFYGAQAFVLPSHQENFGIAVVEALACGVPVLISNKVNIWREIEIAGAGLVAEDSENGVRELLRNFFKIPDGERSELGKRSRSCFQQRFSLAQTTEKLARILTPDGSFRETKNQLNSK